MSKIKCDNCFHNNACTAWIKHGTTIYEDFEYSVEGCPHYISVKDVVYIGDGYNAV